MTYRLAATLAFGLLRILGDLMCLGQGRRAILVGGRAEGPVGLVTVVARVMTVAIAGVVAVGRDGLGVDGHLVGHASGGRTGRGRLRRQSGR